MSQFGSRYIPPELSTLGIRMILEGMNADVAFNDAMRRIDPFASGIVESETASPVSSPTDGEAHIVGASPTGVWSRYAGFVAIASQDSPTEWLMVQPEDGLRVYDQAAGVVKVFRGGEWVEETTIAPVGNRQYLTLRSSSVIGSSAETVTSGTKIRWTTVITERGTSIVRNGQTGNWDSFSFPSGSIVLWDMSIAAESGANVRASISGQATNVNSFLDHADHTDENSATSGRDSTHARGIFITGSNTTFSIVPNGTVRLIREHCSLYLEILNASSSSKDGPSRPDLVGSGVGGSSMSA